MNHTRLKPTKARNHTGDLSPKNSVFTDEDVARANRTHDDRMASATRISGYCFGPPELDKSLPDEELDKVVWGWYND